MDTVTQEKAINLFLELVAINSPSRHEYMIREYILNYLKKCAISTKVDSYGNIIAYPSKEYSEEAILFSCHLDTVPNAVNVNPIKDEKRIYTDGKTALGADDKAAVASLLIAIEEIVSHSISTSPLVLLFSVEEEIGLEGVRHLDKSLLPPIKEVYVLDAQQAVGNYVTHSPAKLDAIITFRGKAAHAGFNPEIGISAISLASRAIDQMKLLRIDKTTTANIGTIMGGSATNIVADHCEIHLEVRSNTQERCYRHLAHLEMCCIKAVGAIGGSYSLESELKYPPYTLEETDPALKKFVKICKELRISCIGESTGGGSDTNILRGFGLDAITLASGYTKAHSVEESIPIEAFSTLHEVIIALARKEM